MRALLALLKRYYPVSEIARMVDLHFGALHTIRNRVELIAAQGTDSRSQLKVIRDSLRRLDDAAKNVDPNVQARASALPLPNILRDYLDTQECRNGIYLISRPRSYQHPKANYDQQYGSDKKDLAFFKEEGRNVIRLCEEYGYNSQGPLLEIGCGSSRLSLSLVLSGTNSEILLTDPSPAFCEIAKRKVDSVLPGNTKVKTAVLAAEDIGLLPHNTFSLIILRSTLHHILNVERFLTDCSHALLPGGMVLFEEPFYEGYLMMGVVTQCMPEVLKGYGVELSEKHLSDISLFAETMRFMARRDVDKREAEDKHLFRADELIKICDRCEMRLHLFPNRMFSNIQNRDYQLPEKFFEDFYFAYIRSCLMWDEALIEIFSRYARKYLEYFSVLSRGGALPYTYGAFLCKKKSDLT